MGKTDSISKQYADDNERFCELINAGVFQGRKILIPENLKTVNTQEYTVDLKTETARQRDILKHCVIKTDGKTTFLLIGLENTSYIDYRAPLRSMLYNGLNLEKQLDWLWDASLHESGYDRDELLSKRRKDTKANPCITFLWNLSGKPYNGPLSLYELLDLENLGKEVRAIVEESLPNNRVYLIDPNTMDMGLCEEMNTDLKYVLPLLKAANQRKEFHKEWKKYSEVPMTSVAIELVGAVTGRKCKVKEGEDMSTLKESMDYVIEEEAKERSKELAKELAREEIRKAKKEIKKEARKQVKAAERNQKAAEKKRDEAMNTLITAMYVQLQKGLMSLEEVLAACHMSKSTFYKYVKTLNL